MIIWPVFAALLLLMPGTTGSVCGQNRVDSVALNRAPAKAFHSPTKATILATVIPGAGQAYNRKYWKIPIVYVGLAGAGYALVTNQKSYRQSKNDYLAEVDTLESTVNQSGKTKGQLLSDIDNFRRFRDLSVLALLAWHGLSIIDANVDAHFFNWDVSEDLSLKIRPRALWVGERGPGIGLSFVLNNY